MATLQRQGLQSPTPRLSPSRRLEKKNHAVTAHLTPVKSDLGKA